MLLQSVAVMSLLVVWASFTPVSETVVHSVRIVPKRNATHLTDGALTPGSLTPSSSISGQVVEVLVSELADVRKGEVLFRLDPREFSIRREGEIEKCESLEREINSKSIESKLAQSTYEAQKAELLAQIESEKQDRAKLALERSIRIRKATFELNRIERDLARMKKLNQQRAVSKSELDSAKVDFLSAKEELAFAKLPLSESRVGELESRFEAASSSHKELVHQIDTEKLSLEGRLSSTRNQIEMLDLKIAQCVVVAPVAGSISTCNVRVGDWIAPGEVEITVSQRGFMAEALLPSRLIGNVKPGDRAMVSLDGIDLLINGSLVAQVSDISTELCQEEIVTGDGSSHFIDGYRVLMDLEKNKEFEKWSSIRIGMTGAVEIETGKRNLAIWMIEKAVGNDWFAPN